MIAWVTGELAGLAEKAAVLRNGRRALPAALTGRMRGRVRRAASLVLPLELRPSTASTTGR